MLLALFSLGQVDLVCGLVVAGNDDFHWSARDQPIVLEPGVRRSPLGSDELGLIIHVVALFPVIGLDGQLLVLEVYLDDGALDLLVCGRHHPDREEENDESNHGVAQHGDAPEVGDPFSNRKSPAIKVGRSCDGRSEQTMPWGTGPLAAIWRN